jgi:SAM-dependent methyltransferase
MYLLGKRESILDVGCGEGILTRLLKVYFKNSVVGLDLDINRIQIAKMANKDHGIDFICEDFLLFEPKNTFDLIVFNDFLHHKSSIEQGIFLDHAIGLLSKNGKILIKDIANFRTFDYALTSRIDKVNYPEDLLTFNSRETWETVFESKDLQVAAWRVEALTHLHGLSGYLNGIQLLVLLHETFWDRVFPLLEEEDSSARTKPIRWLLSESLKSLNSHFIIDQGDPKLGHSLMDLIRVELLKLSELLDSKLGVSAPSFDEIFVFINNILLSNKLDKEPLTDQNIHGDDFQSQSTHSFSRDSLYAEIANISSKLTVLEPHSPVPFILREISQWKSSSFEDILKKLPKDGNSIYDLYKLFAKK